MIQLLQRQLEAQGIQILTQSSIT
ncbi:MAG: hypothetical protein ACP8RL_06395 [cyanobacterium endosymbiont of Rhopalodia inflata]